MYLGLADKAFEKLIKKFPTRYDDIMKEIKMEKAGVREYREAMKPPENLTYYTLGDKLGEKLNKIL